MIVKRERAANFAGLVRQRLELLAPTKRAEQILKYAGVGRTIQHVEFDVAAAV